MSTPTVRVQQKWAALVAHIAIAAIAEQHKPFRTYNRGCQIEAIRATHEGRLRLAVLLFVAAAGGDVFVASLRSDYRFLPKIPASARRVMEDTA